MIDAENRFTQTIAPAELLYGGGGDSFRKYSADIQDNVLWLLRDLIEECRDAVRAEQAQAARQKRGAK